MKTTLEIIKNEAKKVENQDNKIKEIKVDNVVKEVKVDNAVKEVKKQNPE